MSKLTLNADPAGMTPLQLVDGRWYKRDDLLRYDNGVSGKIRAALYLGQLAKDAGAEELIYAGSVLAPALGRVASAANYLDMGCQIVVGSDPDKAVRHETVRVCVEAGARLVRSPIAYNNGLQKRARDIVEASGGRVAQVPYGVSTPKEWAPDQVRAFLDQDAPQVIPLIETPEIERLVFCLGSGNVTSALLYGLDKYGSGNLKELVLFGVGPDHRQWVADRLDFIGVDMDNLPQIVYRPLHPLFAEYADRMPEHVDGIDFHPLYEGKAIRYLQMTQPDWWAARDGRTAFWIIGGPITP